MLAASGRRCKPGAVGPAGRSLYIPLVIKAPRILLLLGLLLLAGPAFGACADSPAPGVVWRRCLLDNADFSGRDLTGATLRDSSFARARFVEAKLNGIDGSDARFSFADMSRADLTGATLRSTDLTRAVLAGATLKGADLRRATLFRADLRGADLTGAELTGANLSGADFSGARWLDGEKICGAGSIGSCQ
ncbi:MAG: pentapeptide repeat-containing protein [Roseomonas sp.]|nr:pentapeptide repeat-containing protein [Roseomonas sp.]